MAEIAAPVPIVTDSIAPPVTPPVAVPATPVPKATAPEDKGADALTPAFIAVRAVSFAALLAMIGAVAFRFFVLPRASNLDGSTHGHVTQRIARLAAVSSALFVLAAIVRLYLENRMMSGDAAMDVAHLRTMTMSTNWGAAWRAQVIAGVVALAAFVLARRMPVFGWLVAALACLVLAFATALGGHAGSSEHFRTLSLADDTVHILGASGWMGSLLWLVIAIGGTARTSAGGRASRVAALVNAFSPVALGFATLIAITGVVSAWLRIGELSALWSSSYGQVLIVKLVLLVLLAASGFHNWRRVRPAVGSRDEATARLRRSANLELTLGLLVVVATAILVATPTPLAP
jgi:putative copper export protein